jgi:hypothetical protein
VKLPAGNLVDRRCGPVRDAPVINFRILPSLEIATGWTLGLQAFP